MDNKNNRKRMIIIISQAICLFFEVYLAHFPNEEFILIILPIFAFQSERPAHFSSFLPPTEPCGLVN